jgi:hypothetical protein
MRQNGNLFWPGLHFDGQIMRVNTCMKEVRDVPQHRQDRRAALALLYLTLHGGYRGWKGFDWDVLGRLHDKGMIGDPVGKV